LNPIGDSAHVLATAAIDDVTVRQRNLAELAAARESAECAREIADRANQGKSRFLATASHDLRQPLQTLSLLNGTLRRIVTDPDATEALSQQEQAICAMSRLLNALLDISKLESGAIKPEPTDFKVAAVFAELRSDFAGLAANKGLTLRIEPCMDCVHSDPSLVEQILRNLVSNAIKYTRQGWIQLRCLHEAAFVRIEVLDTGVGIPADQLAYIYDEFYQVGVPTNTSRDGYGLGLSIVQRLVKLLNLRLDVRSEVGKGSAFSLALPSSSESIALAQAVSQELITPQPRMGRVNVLLVEDDPPVRNATRMLLKAEGYSVTAVESLAEALQRARQEKVDLLVTDYHLSGGETGIQVIAALREIFGLALKAVLMTGDTSTAVREFARDTRLRVASKPIKAEELLILLRALLAVLRVLPTQYGCVGRAPVENTYRLGSGYMFTFGAGGISSMQSPNSIHLPRPAKACSTSVFDALKRRRTIREISRAELPLQILSNLLWAACGVNRETGPFGLPGRTAASASNSQEIDLYVALQSGVYLYDGANCLLSLVVADDLRGGALTPGQHGAEAKGPVQLIYVVDIERFTHTRGFPERGLQDPEVQMSYYCVDTGLIAGNVYLFAAAEGLAAWFHNCHKTDLARRLALRPEQRVLFAQSVGYPEERAADPDTGASAGDDAPGVAVESILLNFVR